MSPRLAEQVTQTMRDGDNLPLPELTAEEQDKILLEARKRKQAAIEQEKYNREYWQKITMEKPVPRYSAEELLTRLTLSRNTHGKRFVVDSENKAQVNTLCLYFSGDPRLEEYGLSHDKGVLLIGPLGVGKSHLMSFFFQNQKASYVMAPCHKIEDEWANAKPEDRNVIVYYSQLVDGALNTNPYKHLKLGTCFDELGNETTPSKRFGEEKNVMQEIILRRYDRAIAEINFQPSERQMPFYKTHFTTNLTADGVKTKYGDRVRDRLKEMCNMIVFPEDTKSRRA